MSPKSRELFADLMKPNCLVSKLNEMKVWSFLDVRLKLLYQQYQTNDQVRGKVARAGGGTRGIFLVGEKNSESKCCSHD